MCWTRKLSYACGHAYISCLDKCLKAANMGYQICDNQDGFRMKVRNGCAPCLKERVLAAFDKALEADEAAATNLDEKIDAYDVYKERLQELNAMCPQDAPFLRMMDSESPRLPSGSYYYAVSDDFEEDEYDEDGDWIGPAQPRGTATADASAAVNVITSPTQPEMNVPDSAVEDIFPEKQISVKKEADIAELRSASSTESEKEAKLQRQETEMYRWGLRNRALSGSKEPAVRVPADRIVLTEKIDGTDLAIWMRLMGVHQASYVDVSDTESMFTLSDDDLEEEEEASLIVSAPTEKSVVASEEQDGEGALSSSDTDYAHEQNAVTFDWEGIQKRAELYSKETPRSVVLFYDDDFVFDQDTRALDWTAIQQRVELEEESAQVFARAY